MKKIFKTSVYVLLVVLTASCAVLKANMSKVSLGMSKDEVRHALKIKPDNIVSSERLPNNKVLEVIQYTMYDDGYGWSNYLLYFVDGKLDRWSRLERGVVPTSAVSVHTQPQTK